MQAADDQLADPDLSPALLAAQSHVSVRTLHRAFAAAGEPVGAYIRRRRLEQARADLAAAPGRADVADVAARWQFADSSHLTRAFKKHYGDTPARFARSALTGPAGQLNPPMPDPHNPHSDSERRQARWIPSTTSA